MFILGRFCCLFSYLIALLLLLEVESEYYPCSSDEAAIDGYFQCLPNCDENHNYNGQNYYYDLHYCLNYFPNNGKCYQRPFDRVDVMNCRGLYDENSSNRWIVWIGGSNSFTSFKVMTDQLLNLDVNVPYNPQVNWDAPDDCPSTAELAFMDFVWDADHNSIYRIAEGFESNTCYYCIPSTASETFNNVNVPLTGAFRVSYISLHYASDFINRFETIVPYDSPWLTTNPSIDVFFEWTGMWGDFYTSESLHAENIQYLMDRQSNEGFRVNSFVVTDSSSDCNSGEYSNTEQIKSAISSTSTNFPKYFFSKRNMMHQEYLTTSFCMTNGHLYQPIAHVMNNRYYNIICPANKSELTLYQEEVPICVDFYGYENQCFYTDYFWMSNLYPVCPMRFQTVRNAPQPNFCPTPAVDDSQRLPVCTATRVNSASDESLSSETNISSETSTRTAFDVFVYLIAAACMVFILVASCLEGCNAWNLIYSSASFSKESKEKTDERDIIPDSEKTDPSKNLDKDAPLKQSDIEMPIIIEAGDNQVSGVGNVEVSGVVDSSGDNQSRNRHEGSETAVAPTDEETNNKASKPIEKNDFVRSKGCLPVSKDPTKFEAIGFARYLASVHIVLGHMYQGGHLSSFHNFNKFGFTWVPWFFVLSGFILTFTEFRRRSKEKASSAAERPLSVVDYVNRRLEMLYPTYLIGILISIATVWAIKGSASLPPAPNVLLYFLLLQSWVPSILEQGLTYLVQCWFLSCLVFYWLLFYCIYDFVHSLSDRLLLGLAFCLSILVPLVYELASIGDSFWYNSHQYMSTGDAVDVAAVTLKYHPLAYLHIFTLGCCLPRLRVMILGNSIFKYFLPFTSLFGYVWLIVIFLFFGDEVPGWNLSFRLGLISFLQCVVLLGLSFPQDILGRVFCLSFLKRLGLYGYAQYVFQFIVYGWYSFATKESQVDIRYFLLLFATSVIVWTVITPLNNKKRMNQLVVVCSPWVVIYLILQPFFSSYMSSSQGSGTSVVVPTTVLPEGWTDSKFTVSLDSHGYLPGYYSERYIFNPSIHIDDKASLFAVRRDYVSSYGSNWLGDDYFTNKWETQLLLGSYNENLKKQVATLVTLSNFKPCMGPLVCDRNGTLTAKVTTGPEDPRVFRFNGDLYISFFSFDNIMDISNSTDIAIKSSVEYSGVFGSGTDLCKPTKDGLIGRMYVSKLGKANINPCILHTPIPVHQRNFFFDPHSIVKNWLTFTHKNNATDEEELFFIHQISPSFMIMRAYRIDNESISTELAFNSTTPREIYNLDLEASNERRSYSVTLEPRRRLDTDKENRRLESSTKQRSFNVQSADTYTQRGESVYLSSYTPYYYYNYFKANHYYHSRYYYANLNNPYYYYYINININDYNYYYYNYYYYSAGNFYYYNNYNPYYYYAFYHRAHNFNRYYYTYYTKQQYRETHYYKNRYFYNSYYYLSNDFSTDDGDGSYGCPPGYLLFNMHCYKLSTEGLPWSEAVTACEAENGWLVDINHRRENYFIANQIMMPNNAYEAWIGLSDPVPFNFAWVYGNSTYTNFNGGEPNNYAGSENCVEMLYWGQWNDNNCYNYFPYICKTRANPITSSPTFAPTYVPTFNVTTANQSFVHGSANPVLVDSSYSTLSEDYYLSIFHTVSTNDSINYATYAFAFASQPPFEIFAVSHRLPLDVSSASANCGSNSTGHFAFVSGLTLDKCPAEDPSFMCLLISYGVCDHESRVLKVGVAAFERTLIMVSD